MKPIWRAGNPARSRLLAGCVRTRTFAVLLLCVPAAITLPAQTLTTLFSFDGSSAVGSNPLAGLVQATNGALYGSTEYGGFHNCGTIFAITLSGALTTVHNFYGSPCDYLPATLIQAANGDLYGIMERGGGMATDYCLGGCGTVFKVTPTGTLTTLHAFCSDTQITCDDGMLPDGGLVQAGNGDVYGTTSAGGASTYGFVTGPGTVFSIAPSGTLTTIYSFCLQSGCPDGAVPYAGLVQATNGELYGTTGNGGTLGFCPPQTSYLQGCGTVFKMTPSGTLTTLHNFCSLSGCADGSLPTAALVQAANGGLYGTTSSGGAGNSGTVFSITPSGALTTLYSFCSQSGCPDGAGPYTGLVQATDGNFYGTTEGGGANGLGTVFKITPAGALTTLVSFDGANGSTPEAGLVQATNGNLYGTTETGGANGDGTVFSLSVGLGPFVETQPHFGAVGTAITILGPDLTGATSVTFNGTAAVFDVESPTYIRTTVPAGATTGKVEVTTPGDTLLSGFPFLVQP
jgi:uncharacterized repeat protein (TIGR03803 family)